jgi:hypothetical protein
VLLAVGGGGAVVGAELTCLEAFGGEHLLSASSSIRA